MSDALTRLGIAHTVEGAVDDGLFRGDPRVPRRASRHLTLQFTGVDCLLENGIALEADGPTHYVGQSHNGATKLRRRLLAARGVKVVSVPYFGWGRLQGGAAQENYLSEILADRI